MFKEKQSWIREDISLTERRRWPMYNGDEKEHNLLNKTLSQRHGCLPDRPCDEFQKHSERFWTSALYMYKKIRDKLQNIYNQQVLKSKL